MPENVSVVVQTQIASDKITHIDPFVVKSVATGEEYKVVGEIAGDKPLYIMLYKAFGLESGSGYVDTNGNLFVLTAATTLTDATRQQLGVDNS